MTRPRVRSHVFPFTALLSTLGGLGSFACGSETADGAGGGGVSGASGATSGGAAPTGGGAGVASGGAATSGGTGGGLGGAASGGAATGGAGPAGGTSGMTGGAGAGGTADGGVGGSGQSGAGGRASGGSGGASTGGAAGTMAGSGGAAGPDPKPHYSFFVASMAGLLSLATDKTNGFGGDFRFGEATGLAGADKICTTLARRASPGDTKVWRAFLSTTGMNGGERVDAIDRVGPGPWYDFNGRLFAMNVAGLMPASGMSGGRPAGDPQLMAAFTDENGVVVNPNGEDNHDTLTGSNPQGRLFAMNAAATCEDWTSTTARGMVPVGHSWPRSNSNGRQWIQDHTVNGCEPGINIDGNGGAAPNDYTVGGGGGYGAIYCFALGAVPP